MLIFQSFSKYFILTVYNWVKWMSDLNSSSNFLPENVYFYQDTMFTFEFMTTFNFGIMCRWLLQCNIGKIRTLYANDGTLSNNSIAKALWYTKWKLNNKLSTTLCSLTGYLTLFQRNIWMICVGTIKICNPHYFNTVLFHRILFHRILHPWPTSLLLPCLKNAAKHEDPNCHTFGWIN